MKSRHLQHVLAGGDFFVVGEGKRRSRPAGAGGSPLLELSGRASSVAYFDIDRLAAYRHDHDPVHDPIVAVANDLGIPVDVAHGGRGSGQRLRR